MKTAKEEWIEEQCKNIEKAMMLENRKRPATPSRLSPRPNSTSQQSSKTTVEASLRKAQLFLTDGLSPDVAYTTTNSIPTQDAESLPVPREVIEQAVCSQKQEVSRSGQHSL